MRSTKPIKYYDSIVDSRSVGFSGQSDHRMRWTSKQWGFQGKVVQRRVTEMAIGRQWVFLGIVVQRHITEMDSDAMGFSEDSGSEMHNGDE